MKHQVVKQFQWVTNCTLAKMFRLILTIFIAYIGLSDACSCQLTIGWQDLFYCQSTWAGTFKVLSTAYDCSTSEEQLYCYDIIVLDQMHGDPAYLTTASTRKDSSMCGTQLTVEHTYFVGAYENNHSITVGLCMLLEDWTNLKCKEINEKKRHYNELDCGNGSTTTTTQEPQEPQKPSECVRTKNLIDINHILCQFGKVLKSITVHFNMSCKCH